MWCFLLYTWQRPSLIRPGGKFFPSPCWFRLLSAITYLHAAIARFRWFFCWVGDVLLLLDAYFLPGLLAFLVGHLLYIVTWRHHCNASSADTLTALQRLRMALPVILFASGIVVVLYPRLGNLQVPVMLYAGVLGYMVLQALFRYGRTPVTSFVLVFAGSVLFMLSDSILAFNKFVQPVAHGNFWIMLTYAVAQFLLVTGILRHEFVTD